MFGNLAFIHRAYCLTYNTPSEMLMPLRNPIYMKDTSTNEVVFQAEVTGRNADLRRLQNLSPDYHIVDGEHHKKYIIQRKDRIAWYRRGNTKADREAILSGLADYHAKIRCDICCISAPTDLWYLKRTVSGTKIVNRYGLTLMLAAMHRLSELARYDPQGLATHLSGKENWLLTEFIELAPSQFVDELACEMTGLEFRLPGVRS
ncbi:hypothetical protein I2H38_16650 [Microvirga sp. BT350]|uniref:Uncharacterized protein n=1 Tax=Microvirga alba TaxID=2791025 RepID=A0A931BTQ3_9HYPH|nr:hypothetical protein [Microvirga alba]